MFKNQRGNRSSKFQKFGMLNERTRYDNSTPRAQGSKVLISSPPMSQNSEDPSTQHDISVRISVNPLNQFYVSNAIF